MTPARMRLLFETAPDQLSRVELKEAEAHANALGLGKRPLPPFALWGTTDPRTLEYSAGLWKCLAMESGELLMIARTERQTVLAKRGGSEIAWTPTHVLERAGSVAERVTEVLQLLDGVSRPPRYRIRIEPRDPERLGVTDAEVLAGEPLVLDAFAVVSVDRKRELREVAIVDVWFGSQCGELELAKLSPNDREQIHVAVFAAHLEQLERAQAAEPSPAAEATS